MLMFSRAQAALLARAFRPPQVVFSSWRRRVPDDIDRVGERAGKGASLWPINASRNRTCRRRTASLAAVHSRGGRNGRRSGTRCAIAPTGADARKSRSQALRRRPDQSGPPGGNCAISRYEKMAPRAGVRFKKNVAEMIDFTRYLCHFGTKRLVQRSVHDDDSTLLEAKP